MVFKTIISLIWGYIGFTQFYPWVKLTVLPSFTQFYASGFTHWVKRTMGKTYMPTLTGGEKTREEGDRGNERRGGREGRVSTEGRKGKKRERGNLTPTVISKSQRL